MRSTAVIAIDGPSGSGKSTLARALAADLGWRYLDTGAMYRAAALAVIEAGIEPGDPDAVTALVERLELLPHTDPAAPGISLGDRDVSSAVRAPEVTAVVSLVAAVPGVRRRLVQLQREVAAEGSAVVEGRDIGSVVFPDACLKVWLTADGAERARRRAAELLASGASTDPTAEQARLERRDQLDAARATSPALPAADALVLDSTERSVDELVAALRAELTRREVSA